MKWNEISFNLGNGAGEGAIIITGLVILGISTIALLALEPHLEWAVTKVIVFAGYIIGAAIFSLVAVDYGRDAGMTGTYAIACAILVAMSVIYMLVSLVKGNDDKMLPHGSHSDTRDHTAEVKNYVPANPPRRYRSMTRRTLHAIKVHKPREHWRVEA